MKRKRETKNMSFNGTLMGSQEDVVKRTPLQKFFDVVLEVLKLVRVFLSTVQNVLSYSPTTHTHTACPPF